MRYATANNLGNTSYSDLLDSCKHSRLRAALASHQPVQRACGKAASTPVVDVDATKAYLWVAYMSLASLLSVVVTGTLTA